MTPSQIFNPSTELAFYGDSITAGLGLSTTTEVFGWQLSSDLGANYFNRGIGGTSVSSTTGALSGELRTSDITNLSPLPNRLFVLYGSNDMVSSPSAQQLSAFQLSYSNMLSSLLSGTVSEGTKIYNIGLLPRGGISTSTLAEYSAVIQGDVLAASSSRALYINSNPWGFANNSGWFLDGIHPNVIGNNVITSMLLPYAAMGASATTSAYTVTGPSTGTVGQASSQFTVSVINGGLFDGSSTITVSDGGNGGTFTPSVGSASSSSVTVTPTASTTSFTFTYTPASSGTKTLTFSDGQGWTDASSTTYTVSLAPSLTSSPSSITAYTTGNSVILSGSSTSWTSGTPGSPTFILSGGTGASITNQSVTSTSSATITVNAGSATGTLVITDPGTNATTTITVVSQSGGCGTAYTPVNGQVYAYRCGTLIGVTPGINQVTGTAQTSTSVPTTTLSTATATPPVIPTSCPAGALFNTQTGAPCPPSMSISTSTPPILPQSWTFTGTLQMKATGDEVKLLQEYLNQHEYTVAVSGPGSPGHETSYFGSATKAALIRFQKASGITPAIGYFGPITRAYIAAHP